MQKIQRRIVGRLGQLLNPFDHSLSYDNDVTPRSEPVAERPRPGLFLARDDGEDLVSLKGSSGAISY